MPRDLVTKRLLRWQLQPRLPHSKVATSCSLLRLLDQLDACLMLFEGNGLCPLGPRPEVVRYQMTRSVQTLSLDNSPSATPPHPHTKNPEHALQRSLSPANLPDGRAVAMTGL